MKNYFYIILCLTHLVGPFSKAIDCNSTYLILLTPDEVLSKISNVQSRSLKNAKRVKRAFEKLEDAYAVLDANREAVNNTSEDTLELRDPRTGETVYFYKIFNGKVTVVREVLTRLKNLSADERLDLEDRKILGHIIYEIENLNYIPSHEVTFLLEQVEWYLQKKPPPLVPPDVNRN